jgi:hypothetical protein
LTEFTCSSQIGQQAFDERVIQPTSTAADASVDAAGWA